MGDSVDSLGLSEKSDRLSKCVDMCALTLSGGPLLRSNSANSSTLLKVICLFHWYQGLPLGLLTLG